jgi:hypothetical protein
MRPPKILPVMEEAADLGTDEEHEAVSLRQMVRKETSLRRARCASRQRDHVEDERPPRGEGCPAPRSACGRGGSEARMRTSCARVNGRLRFVCLPPHYSLFTNRDRRSATQRANGPAGLPPTTRPRTRTSMAPP